MIKKLLQEAFVLKNKGHYKYSIEALYKALEIDPNSLELLFEIAESYYLMNDEERGLEYIEQILAKNPAHINSLNLLKRSFIKKEAWNLAEQAAKNIYLLTNQSDDFVEILKILNKQKKFEDVINYSVEMETAEILYEKAFASFYLLDFEKANSFIDRALNIVPNAIEYLLLKGNILLKLNEDEKAFELLKNVELDEENSSLMNLSGLIYQRNGKYNEALKFFFKALKNSKEKDFCYYNCASTYFKMGNTLQAKKYYNLAISTSPENQSYHIALANLYYSEKNYKRALEELKSDIYEARVLKAVILHDSGYFAIAKKEFDKLIKESPQDSMLKSYLDKIEYELKF